MTSKCNLKCIYCYNDSGNSNVSLSLNKVVAFCRSTVDYWQGEKKEVFLSGGEFFFFENYAEVTKVLYSAGYSVYIVTNGILLTPQVVKSIMFNINGIQLSIDGSNSETHDFLRGRGSFVKIMNNLNDLKKENLLQYVRIRVSIGKSNYEDVLNIIDFAKRMGFRGISFGLIRKQGRGYKEFKEIYEINNDKVYRLKLEIDKKRKQIENDTFEVGIFDVEGGNCILTEENPILDIRIDSNGDIYPCHSFYSPEYKMGNIYSDTMYEVINNSETQQIFTRLRKRRNTLSDCQKCMWQKSICHGGCPAEAFMLYGDIWHLDNKCALRNKFWCNALRGNICKNDLARVHIKYR